jgi:hypothetical protein
LLYIVEIPSANLPIRLYDQVQRLLRIFSNVVHHIKIALDRATIWQVLDLPSTYWDDVEYASHLDHLSGNNGLGPCLISIVVVLGY